MSSGTGTILIIIPFLAAFGGAIVAGFFASGTLRYASLAFAGVMLLVGMYVTQYAFKALIARCAVLIMSPHGVQDPARAEALLGEYLSSPYLPTIAIRQGKIAEGSDMSLLRRGEQLDVSLQQTTGRGPAYLDIDSVSAVLLRQAGGFVVYQYGIHLYAWNQSYVGAVDLRPQSMPIDETFTTLDGMGVHIKGIISFWITQDAAALKENQVHRVKMEDVRRALMPNPDWRERTIRQLGIKLREVVRQIPLSDFYVTPTHLHQLDLYETVRRMYTQQPLKNMVDELRSRVIGETRDRLADMGVEVRMMVIDSIAPPEAFTTEAKRMYTAWLQELDKQAEMAAHTRTELEQAKQRFQLAELEHKTKVTTAETDKQVEKLKAEAEAVGLETRMKARAVSAVEFARRMELVRQALGDSLDEQTMRELMRALGLLVTERRYGYDQDPRALFSVLGRSRDDEEEQA